MESPEEKNTLPEGAELKALGEWIADTKTTRHDSKDRVDSERAWDEVDRQVAMVPKKWVDDPDFIPELELPLQSMTLETSTADVRRLLFPTDREWFTAQVGLNEADQRRLDFDGAMGFVDGSGIEQAIARAGQTPIQQTISQKGVQHFANTIAASMLHHFHGMYDFRQEIDGIVAEAYKYGSFVGRLREVHSTVEGSYRGGKPRRYPAFVAFPFRQFYPDDTPARQLGEGLEIAPCHIRCTFMDAEDLALAVKKGRMDINDEARGGWIPEVTERMDGDKNGEIEVLEAEGDIVVPRETGPGMYLPGVIVNVALGAGGPIVYRYRRKKYPFNSYITGSYHRDKIESTYAVSPLMKGVPIQASATAAMKFMLVAAALAARPPVKYEQYDHTLSAAGGPEMKPGALWPSLTRPEPVLLGDTVGPITNAYAMLVSQYREETGMFATRLGQQTKSHQSAFAVDQEMTRGLVRTVDFVRSLMQGPLLTMLHMEYEMARNADEQMIHVSEYDGFLNVSGEQLPENVVFQITGSGTPSEEREKRLAEIQALQALLQTEEVARAFGGKPSDITAIRERIVRLGGILDTKTYLPDSGGTAGTAQGVPSGPAGGPPIQGAAGPVSAAPSA